MALVPLHTEIAAGQVVPFVSSTKLIPVVLPPHMKASDVEAVTVCGCSLEDMGIFSGDVLIFTKLFDKQKIWFNTVCIVYIHSTQELIAKKLVPAGEGMITLRASGGGIKDKTLPIDDVEIRGAVFAWQILAKNRPDSEFGF